MTADSLSATDKQESRRSVPKDFRPDIEGLRAFTLVAILLFHAEMPGAGGGFVGPDIFFIISGFVITGQLWNQVSSTGSIGLRSFYGSRARRLLPVSALVGIVTVVASAMLLPPIQARSVMGDGIASALYVCNYWFIGQNVDYFSTHLPPSPFQHYWTLAVEEQFYLVWPLIIIGTAVLIRLARRWRPGTRTEPATPSKRPYIVVFAVITIGSFTLSLLLTYLVPAAAYFSLPTRAWDLSVGGLAALALNQWRRIPPRAAKILGWAGFGLILWACVVFTPGMAYPGTAALVPMIGTVLVLGAGVNAPTVGCGRILSWSPMRATGRLSYSWYLWHWPILVLAPVLLGFKFGLFGNLMTVVISGGLAMLTLRYIENPLRYAAPLRRSPGASLALGGAVTAVAAVVGFVALAAIPTTVTPPTGRGAPAAPLTITETPVPPGSTMAAYNAAVQRTFAQVQAAVAASADLKAVPSNLNPAIADVATADQVGMLHGGCMRLDKESGQPECAMGDVGSSTRVALVGDSHASMWTPAFQQLATQRHWRLELMAKAGCPLLDVPVAKYLNSIVEQFRHCEQWRGEIRARLRAERPRLIVVTMSREHVAGSWQAGFTPYDPAWIASLTRLVRQLREETGAKVLVLGPIPDPQAPVPDCLSRHLDDASACAPPTSTAMNDAGMAAEAAATTANGGQYADLTDLFCTTNRCPVIVGNTLVYFDWNHMTLEYSRQLGPAMGALADRALAAPVGG
ncbi:acyltransferase family protein [Mycolicibacterium sp. Dal123E01]|uniref:acyltransferase family protein n=1 Tax=Mycolicibacterium sp. Dal123E01 TaxID=3457578 RepID=UPI00403E3731